jgi:hypothetical protein
VRRTPSSNPPAHKARRGRNRPQGFFVPATIHVPRRAARGERAEGTVAISRSLKGSGEPKPPETGASGPELSRESLNARSRVKVTNVGGLFQQTLDAGTTPVLTFPLQAQFGLRAINLEMEVWFKFEVLLGITSTGDSDHRRLLARGICCP